MRPAVRAAQGRPCFLLRRLSPWRRASALGRPALRRRIGRCKGPLCGAGRTDTTDRGRPRSGDPKCMKAESRRSNGALDVVRMSDKVSTRALGDPGLRAGQRQQAAAGRGCPMSSPGQITDPDGVPVGASTYRRSNAVVARPLCAPRGGRAHPRGLPDGRAAPGARRPTGYVGDHADKLGRVRPLSHVRTSGQAVRTETAGTRSYGVPRRGSGRGGPSGARAARRLCAVDEDQLEPGRWRGGNKKQRRQVPGGVARPRSTSRPPSCGEYGERAAMSGPAPTMANGAPNNWRSRVRPTNSPVSDRASGEGGGLGGRVKVPGSADRGSYVPCPYIRRARPCYARGTPTACSTSMRCRQRSTRAATGDRAADAASRLGEDRARVGLARAPARLYDTV